MKLLNISFGLELPWNNYHDTNNTVCQGSLEISGLVLFKQNTVLSISYCDGSGWEWNKHSIVATISLEIHEKKGRIHVS